MTARQVLVMDSALLAAGAGTMPSVKVTDITKIAQCNTDMGFYKCSGENDQPSLEYAVCTAFATRRVLSFTLH